MLPRKERCAGKELSLLLKKMDGRYKEGTVVR